MSDEYKERFIVRGTSTQRPAVRELRDVREVWRLPATFKDEGKDASTQG